MTIGLGRALAAFLRRGRVLAVLAVVLAVCAVGVWQVRPAGTGSHRAPDSRATFTAPSPAGGQRARSLGVVALGDSVTSGANCACVPFPQVYGRLLRDRRQVRVTVDNRGAGGLDSGDLVGDLGDPGSSTARAVRRAEVVLITIGANDFGDHHDDVARRACLAECVGDELPELGRHVRQVLGRVRSLRDGRRTTVLVTGYWNVFEDGEVASREFPEPGRAATVRLTRRVNDLLRSVSRSEGATYVDLFGPFRLAARSGGVTRLLAADGDHPDAAGHALIARTLLGAGLPALHRR